MKVGHLLRGTPHPAPVGRPDYYTRELHSSLFLRSSSGLPTRNFLTPDHHEPGPGELAKACYAHYGVYPLNFSFPTVRVAPVTSGPRENFLSTTYPGVPHSFDDWGQYLEEYRSSFFALSTKKGGWDTFRHLEILFSGAIPLMPSLGNASRFALAHYPKKLLSGILDSLMTEGPAVPDEATQSFVSQWAKDNLTTRAMARYLVDVSGMNTERVVFLDSSLPKRTDYLSAFSFIGLTEVLGKHVCAAFEPAFLFDDFHGDTNRLYGKGFGYTRVIPSGLRSTESLDHSAPLTDLVALARSASTLVVGNYDANRDLVGALLESGISPDKFVCILGSDTPPDRALLRGIRRSGMTFFVREFPASEGP